MLEFQYIECGILLLVIAQTQKDVLAKMTCTL